MSKWLSYTWRGEQFRKTLRKKGYVLVNERRARRWAQIDQVWDAARATESESMARESLLQERVERFKAERDVWRDRYRTLLRQRVERDIRYEEH